MIKTLCDLKPSASILRARVRRRLSHARPGDDQGIALIMVMGFIVVLGLLMTAALGYAMQAQPQERRDQAWQAALAAAQAGVDDYVARLNGDDNYYDSVDCTNVAMKGPKLAGSCGLTASSPAQWKEVKPGDPSAGAYHYDVDATNLFRDGYMMLTVTGRQLNEYRTLQVRVGKPGSTQYLYYTDFESADPSNRTAYPPNGTTSNTCGRSGTSLAKYWWQGRSGCQEIQFIGADTLDGPVHFNDTPLIGNSGATFKKGFETADPDCKSVTGPNWSGCGRTSTNPNIPAGQKARWSNVLTLPDTSDQLDSADRSCKFSGDTRIKFLTDGTMQVWSKRAPVSVGGLSCGSLGTVSGGNIHTTTTNRLNHVNGQNLPQPDEALIYIKNGPSTSRCATTGQIGDGIPLNNDWNYKNTTSPENAFYCGNGNAYIEGTVKARLSVGAQNHIFVTGNLLLSGVTAGQAPSGPYMVGLIAANSVYVYHPITCSSVYSSGSRKGMCETGSNILSNTTRYIYASIQTLQHSFTVQVYDVGAKIGDLAVRGSIAQRWRGAVGTGSGWASTGYDKDYGYDTRLVYSSPPYFPKLDGAGWGSKVTGEVKPVYG